MNEHGAIMARQPCGKTWHTAAADGVRAVPWVIAVVTLISSLPVPAAEPPGADVTALRDLKLPPVEKQPWVFEGFPIMAWWPPPGTKTLEDFQSYKHAGFTIYMANPDAGFENAMKLARKAGLPVMPHRSMGGFDVPRPDQPVAFPANDPNVVGWVTHDEPGWIKAAVTATTEVNGLMRADPSRWTLFNNLPLHRPQKLPVLEIAEAALRNGMPVLSYDNYVILESGKDRTKEHFDNLASARTLSLKYDVPFWAFALTTKHREYRRPSESDLRWKQFTNLAYGAKGLWYFCYWGPHRWDDKGWDTKSIVDSATGEPTELYHQVKQLNETVLAMGDVLLGLTSEAVAHTRPPQGHAAFQKNKHWITDIGAQDALIGCFRDDAGDRYALVVNKLHGKGKSSKETADTIELTFAPDIKAVEAVSWLDGTPGKLPLRGGKTSLRVHGGTGVLIKAKTSAETGIGISASEFLDPPDPYKSWVYWWWLNGWIDEEGIRADLDHMKRTGISGALVFHAGPAKNKTPFTTEFMSPRWRELFRYAVEQAALRKIEIGLNMCDGWNMGGPWITPELAISTKAKTKEAGGTRGFELDPFNPAAMDLHWENIIEKITKEAGEEWCNQYVGKTFKYTHIDSWEGGDPKSSPVLAAEFKARRGYDLGSKSGIRYMEDLDLTRSELWADNCYGRLSELNHALGMRTHSQAGGPSRPLYDYMGDMLRNFGSQDIVMGEYWSRQHDKGTTRILFHNDNDQDFYGKGRRTCDLKVEDLMKSASSAAHIYGRKIVQAEAFTHIHGNFSRSFWELKDIGDRAFCQGLNRNVLCFMVAQAGGDAKPGYGWRNVGMEFPRTLSYWPMGKAWVDYLNRCHYLLQQGTFVADFLYFHGNRGPVMMPAKFHMQPAKPEGFDCDMVNAHALLTRASVKDNRIAFPDGQSYRYLVLRADNTDALTPDVLNKLRELVSGGVTLIGHPPERPFGYEGFPASDEEFKKLREEIWGQDPGASGSRTLGSGRVVWGSSLQETVEQDRMAPDLEIVEDRATRALPDSVMSGLIGPGFDYVHRKAGPVDVYFLANLRNAEAAGVFTFRCKGRPQVWNPIDGSIRWISDYENLEGDRTRISLDFEARQSLFVVFGSDAPADETYHNNEMVFDHGLSGPWKVTFDTAWGGPGDVDFNELSDWKDHSDNGIKYYSGTATYTRTFDLPPALRRGDRPIYLDLGSVKDMAKVTLNGTPVGVVWCEPFQLEITGVVKPTGNVLSIDVVNKWSNRLMGDEVLKESYTTGNASHDTFLYSSGLLGPLKLGQPARQK